MDISKIFRIFAENKYENMNKYVNLDEIQGKFFLSSKERKEGYEEYTSSKGNVSYRFYFNNGVYGVFKGVSLREVEYSTGKVKRLQVTMEYGDDLFFIQMPWGSSKIDFSDYVLHFLFCLKNLEKEKAYRINPFVQSRESVQKYQESIGKPSANGKYRDRQVIRVSEVDDLENFKEGEYVKTNYFYTDLPKLEFIEDEFGKPTVRTESKIKRSAEINRRFEEDLVGKEFIYRDVVKYNPMQMPSTNEQPKSEEDVEV